MKKSTIAVIITAFFVLISWGLNWYLVNSRIPSPQEQGQFGDMFGATTSLFSGLTIIGLIYTIYLQREDIRIARLSLSEQKSELILTRKEFTQQNKTLKLQRFETTFFNMLKLNSEIIANFPDKRLTIKFEVGNLARHLEGFTTFEALQEQYNNRAKFMIKDTLGHYFNNIEMISKIIEIEKKTIKGKEKYLGILFSQLSEPESTILFYHFMLRDDGKSYFDLYNPQFLRTVKLIDEKHKILLNRRE